jgi:hypothetical protein
MGPIEYEATTHTARRLLRTRRIMFWGIVVLLLAAVVTFAIVTKLIEAEYDSKVP